MTDDAPQTPGWSEVPGPLDADLGASEGQPVETVLSEERLRVGTDARPHTRLRIRKVIVTEERTITVTVRHEELRIDEESITDGDPATATDGDDFDMVLHEEQVEVVTRIVPTERVHVHKERVTIDVPVTEALRHEAVEITTDPAASASR